MDGGELPKFVLDSLSLGPEHHLGDKFNEVHYPADVDKFLRELRQNKQNKVEGEKRCEIEECKKCRQNPNG